MPGKALAGDSRRPSYVMLVLWTGLRARASDLGVISTEVEGRVSGVRREEILGQNPHLRNTQPKSSSKRRSRRSGQRGGRKQGPCGVLKPRVRESVKKLGGVKSDVLVMLMRDLCLTPPPQGQGLEAESASGQ